MAISNLAIYFLLELAASIDYLTLEQLFGLIK
jgi:hypothetical protein